MDDNQRCMTSQGSFGSDHCIIINVDINHDSPQFIWQWLLEISIMGTRNSFDDYQQTINECFDDSSQRSFDDLNNIL